MADPVFVFEADRAGRHGKGAAKWALENRGAVYGQGEGRQGNSYAIPTKDARLATLPVSAIREHVIAFCRYAADHPDLVFELTPIGCGLAGYRPDQIAPLFKIAPMNVRIPAEFKPYLEG